MEFEPCRAKIRVLEKRVLETPERPPARDSALEDLALLGVADTCGEVREIGIALARVEGLDASETGRRLEILVDGFAVPHRVARYVNFAGLRIEPPGHEVAVVFEGVAELA